MSKIRNTTTNTDIELLKSYSTRESMVSILNDINPGAGEKTFINNVNSLVDCYRDGTYEELIQETLIFNIYIIRNDIDIDELVEVASKDLVAVDKEHYTEPVAAGLKVNIDTKNLSDVRKMLYVMYLVMAIS